MFSNVLSVAPLAVLLLASQQALAGLVHPGRGMVRARRSHAEIAVRAAEEFRSVVARKEPPATWATGYLEDYNTYHIRYLAIDCEDKHNTTFFNTCCHPLLATEKLETARPAECIPSAAASSSASSAWPTSTVDAGSDDDDSDCDDTTTTEKAKATSTSHTTAKASTSTKKAATTSSKKATSTSSSAKSTKTSSSSSDSDLITGGVGTFFLQNGVAGACGTVHPDSAVIVAMDSARYGSGSLCGKKVFIQNTENGKSVTATVEDECPTCDNSNSIDMSVGAFTQIATEEEGEVKSESKKIKFSFLKVVD